MEEFLNYFAGLTTLQKILWVGICLAFFFILENFIPLVKHEYKRLRHDGVNLFFLSLLMIINVLYGIVLIAAAQWTSNVGFGILNWVEMPIWAGLIVSFVALDLVSQYFAHYLLHRVKWMWKLHMVHHSDTKVDLTTGVRQHPIEFVLREGLALGTFVLFWDANCLLPVLPDNHYIFYLLDSREYQPAKMAGQIIKLYHHYSEYP